MLHRLSIGLGTTAVALLGLLTIGGGPAGAAPAQFSLVVPQGTAFSVLKYDCGGIKELAYVTGYDNTIDPSVGYPTGYVYLTTTCSAGKGTDFTVDAWTADTWDLTGALLSYSVATPNPSPPNPLSATDPLTGNQIYDSASPCPGLGGTGSTAYACLQWASTFTPRPTVTGISPAIGPATGGTSVTISGDGFTGATAVEFGSTPATFTVNSDTSITANSPVSGAGTFDVTVTSAGGTDLTSAADQFTFVAAPVVTGVSPNSGSVSGGYYVTVSGQNFTHTTGVSVGDQATAFVIVSDSELSVYIPASDSGPDSASVIVTTVGGVSSAQFTYTTVTDVAPAITSANSVIFAAGTEGSFTVTATGTPAPTFTETGTLPSGVTFSSTGMLSGTTTQLGTFPITIDAANGIAPDATQSFTLTVNGFQISTSSLPNATPGVAYGPVQLQAIGQASGAALTWNRAGTLPRGLVVVVGGFLEGTPSLKLAHGANLSVPVRVTETWFTVSGRIKTKHSLTVTKTLTVNIN